MIQEVITPGFLNKQALAIQSILEIHAKRMAKGDPFTERRVKELGLNQQNLEAVLEALKTAESPAEERAQLTWIPRDPTLSILQSVLTEEYIRIGAVPPRPEGFATDNKFIPVTDVALLPQYANPAEIEKYDQYGEGDPLFGAGWALARALSLNGKADSKEPSHRSINENARVILFGDWGSGLPRAEGLSRAIRSYLTEANGKDRHVIHLGDVYYAGFEEEYRRNVLTKWPVDPGQDIGCWALNGNHDMYTGGRPYFEVMLGDERFKAQGGASRFCLENKYWQILALDTSYDRVDWRGDKAGLSEEQAAWVVKTRRAAPHKGGILLSHHQLFSPWEGQSDVLLRRLGPLLRQGLVKSWFWGHEHRCAVYSPHLGIEYPCLLGHAGVPVRYTGTSDFSVVLQEWNDHIVYDGHSYTTLGAAVLDFKDKNVRISFFNERGDPALEKANRTLTVT
jgi:3',5'-cyclic AMP phosphodiesterase CpdA